MAARCPTPSPWRENPAGKDVQRVSVVAIEDYRGRCRSAPRALHATSSRLVRVDCEQAQLFFSAACVNANPARICGSWLVKTRFLDGIVVVSTPRRQRTARRPSANWRMALRRSSRRRAVGVRAPDQLEPPLGRVLRSACSDAVSASTTWASPTRPAGPRSIRSNVYPSISRLPGTGGSDPTGRTSP